MLLGCNIDLALFSIVIEPLCLTFSVQPFTKKYVDQCLLASEMPRNPLHASHGGLRALVGSGELLDRGRWANFAQTKSTKNSVKFMGCSNTPSSVLYICPWEMQVHFFQQQKGNIGLQNGADMNFTEAAIYFFTAMSMSEQVDPKANCSCIIHYNAAAVIISKIFYGLEMSRISRTHKIYGSFAGHILKTKDYDNVKS